MKFKKTLFEAIILVIIVVYLSPGWRACGDSTPRGAGVLVGTFVVFPMLGFPLTLVSLFGLVLARSGC